MKYILVTLLFASQLLVLQVHAIQEIEVVVADQSFSSSSKVVITEKEIKDSHVNNLATLMSTQANVAVATSNFTPYSIYIRGGDSSHVLFLIDGIPFYDAATISRSVNLSTLNMRAIKKIEVIKGSQSVLYGGQALAGVIKIETFPDQIKNSTDIVLQGGPRFVEGTISSLFKLSDTQAFATSLKKSDAYTYSPVKDSDKTYPQEIGNVDLTYLNRFYEENEAIVKLQFGEEKAEMPSADFVTYQTFDTPNFGTTNKTANISAVVRKPDVYSISFSQQDSRRTYFQSAADDLTGNGGLDEKYDGLLQAVRGDLNLVKTERQRWDVGASFIHEYLFYKSGGMVFSDNFNEYEGAFVKGSIKLIDNIVFEPGYRKEFIRMRSFADLYHAGFTLWDHFKLEHSTGFKTPSLFQLYSSYGNADLKPEKATSTALSYENNINEKMNHSLTFFDSKFSNLILFSPTTSKYENVSKAEAKGFEYFLAYNDNDNGVRVQTSFGYQEPKDLAQGTWLVRRPLRTASLKVNKKLSNKNSAGVEVVHVGDRRDKSGASKFATIDRYTLVHVVGSSQISENFDVFTRIENAGNVSYQPSYGYHSHGPIFRAGLNYTIE